MAFQFDRSFRPRQHRERNHPEKKDVFIITLTSMRMFWVSSAAAFLLCMAFIAGYLLGGDSSESDNTLTLEDELKPMWEEHNNRQRERENIPDPTQTSTIDATNSPQESVFNQPNQESRTQSQWQPETQDSSRPTPRPISGTRVAPTRQTDFSLSKYRTGEYRLPTKGPYFIQIATHTNFTNADYAATIINRNSNFRAVVRETDSGRFVVRLEQAYQNGEDAVADHERLLKAIPERKLPGIGTSRIIGH